MLHQVAWKVGGQQGEGIESTGDILAQVCNRLGYYVYGYRHFSSRIKGGHTNFKLRIGTTQVDSTCDDLEMLIAFDQETIDFNLHELVPGGIVLADDSFKPTLPEGSQGVLLAMPIMKIARELGSTLMRNIVCLGATAYFFGLPRDAFVNAIMKRFGKKGMGEQNIAAFDAGFAYASEHVPGMKSWALAEGDGRSRMLLTGNEAVAFGSMMGGCKIMTAYPITPASEVMQWLMNQFPKIGGVVVQFEDEIASITGAIGAGFAGARAMTATSGPGVSLMQEAIGLAATAEIPVVIIDVQRGGPSTGMPTKFEQSDILAMIYGTHGESPRIVMAPSTAEDTFYTAIDAFNCAERYQCPVFIASDLSLGLNVQTVEDLDYDRIKVEPGRTVDPAQLLEMGRDAFKRYAVTDDGISPRSLPGMKNGQYLATGVEHAESGKVSENAANRVAQMDKRFRKLEHFHLPKVEFDGPEDYDVLLINYGSTIGAVKSAASHMNEEGLKTAHLQLKVLWPFPVAEINEYAARAKKVYMIEGNKTGQIAGLIKQLCDLDVERINKYNGNPFTPADILQQTLGVRV